MATCYWNLTRFDDAGKAYKRARQLDTLRFRADETINRTIRNAAAGADTVHLVDFARTLEQASEHGITSRRHFHEHVHLNFSGNYLLAKTVFEKIESILPAHIRENRVANKPPPDESECAHYLAYTDRDQYKVTEKVLNEYINHPPFTNQLYHDQQVASLTARLDAMKAYIERPSLELSVEAYRWAIRADPYDWNLHYKFASLLADELKDHRAAVAELARVQQDVPHFHRGYTAMGQVLEAQNNIDPAIDQYLKAIRLNPASADAHYYIAGAYRKLKRYDHAADYYRKTIRLHAGYALAYNKLAEMLNQQGQVDRVIEVCRKGLAVAGDDALLHGNLGILLSKKGRKAEAIKELETALELDPDSPNIRRVLEIIRNRPN